MRNRFYLTITVILATVIFGTVCRATGTDDLFVKDCQELMRMAQNLQNDVKTIDTMLGSAIETGNMTAIKNYKMKKASAQNQLQAVLRAIDIKSCVKNK